MSKVINIGHLSLDMGSMSHVIHVTNDNMDTYFKYLAYQVVFEKGNK